MAINPPSPQNFLDWATDFDQIASDLGSDGVLRPQSLRLRQYALGARNYASLGQLVVPTATPPTPQITKVTVSSDVNGQRIDFATDSPVQTYGHDTWTSPVQDPARRTFDLTFLAPNVDVPIKVTWTDGTVTNRIVHTGGAVITPPVVGNFGGGGQRIDATMKAVPAIPSHRLNLFAGVAGHWPYDDQTYSQFDSYMPKFQQIGLTIWRDGWTTAQAGGDAKTQTMWDYANKAFKTYGMRLIYGIDNRLFNAGADNSYATLKQRIIWTMDLIKARVNAGTFDPFALFALEWGNEWEASYPEGFKFLSQLIDEMTPSIKATLTAIGRADLIILAPSMASATNGSLTQQIGDKTGKITNGNTHDYSGGVVYTKAILDSVYGPAQNIVPGAQIASTECDYSNGMTAQAPPNGDRLHPPRTEADCAWLTPQNYLMHFADGRWLAATKYEALSTSSSPSSWEGSFGLLHYDFSLKPAAQSLQTLLAKTRDPANASLATKPLTAQLMGQTGATQTQMMQKGGPNGKTWQLMVWEANESTANVPLTLNLAPGRTASFATTRITPAGGFELSPTAQQSSLQFNSRREPLLIEITLP